MLWKATQSIKALVKCFHPMSRGHAYLRCGPRGWGAGAGAACFRDITGYFATDLLTISPQIGV